MWRLFPSSRRTRWGACWSQGSSVVQSCRLKKRFPPRRYCLTSFSAHASRSRNPRKRRPWRAAASASKHCAPLQSDRQVDVTQRLLVAQITTKEHHLPDAVRPGFIAIDGLDPRQEFLQLSVSVCAGNRQCGSCVRQRIARHGVAPGTGRLPRGHLYVAQLPKCVDESTCSSFRSLKQIRCLLDSPQVPAEVAEYRPHFFCWPAGNLFVQS
jgi:hypothetical protein